MASRVKLSPSALADAEETFLWRRDQYGNPQATRWYNGLADARASQEEIPIRYPLASVTAIDVP